MERLRVGIAGAGFAARLHIDAWRRVAGIDVELAGITSAHPDRASELARAHGVTTVHDTFDDLVADDGIDVVDLCVPNHVHASFARAALHAGRHVVVEKPLTGCFVRRGDASPSEMLERAVADAESIVAAASDAGRLCCYAENWVYAPPVAKAEQLLGEADGTILRMQGEESHSGTHSEPNKHWVTAGGGALLGKGCHPLGAALHLKAVEGMRRDGRAIRPQSVIAQTASLTTVPAFVAERQHHLRTGYEDVEDWGLLLVTFDDGTVAEIVGGDTTLGGVQNRLRVFASNVVIEANLNPNSAVRAYAPAADVLAGAYLSEKLETHAGWSSPAPDEDWMQGYPQEMQDFAAAIVSGRAPRSDARLGRDVVVVIYAAYVAAAEGRRVDVSRWFPAEGFPAKGPNATTA
jgi:predicted dehydrogenase